jgi:hypothetical protein
MQFKKINNIAGWIICLIACTVYILTTEARGSFWDCGEFVSSCFKLQIPHPPGAPLFVLMGRVFIIMFGDNPLTAAKAINIMNALASGFTILFLFWTITHFARKILNVKTSDFLTGAQAWSIIGAGAVGALAYTFSDSFWYSAVEGEVYALSSFFTAIVFWAILKWENHADEPGADKWIVFIFFMMGLSIGVHLLNLLTIPAIVMVYYFRRKDSFNYAVLRKWFLRIVIGGGVLAFIGALVMASREATPNVPTDSTQAGLMILATIVGVGLLFLIENFNKQRKAYIGGMYIFFVIGCVITGLVQVGVIQYSVKMAGSFDRVFNTMGMPVFGGFILFFVLLAVIAWFLLRLASRKGWSYLRLALWCVTFMLIGYSTYITTMIRSSANPSVDMYNVDNPISLEGYLGREQYGDFPLLYGQKFTASPADLRETKMRYQRSGDKYIELGMDRKYVYASEDKMIFPRVWDPSNDQNHADYYASFLGIGKSQQGFERAPNQADNIKFFAGYQMYWMYMRYFLWNFAGKQNDNQGLFTGNVRDGNWITGLPIDNLIYGDQSMMPDSLKNNKANNKLFALPLILGLIGMIYQFKRKGSDGVTTLLLFFFTGVAVVLYLNQAGFQPRERDYAYVGSFYAFAIWIGLSVMCVVDLATNWNQKFARSMLVSGWILSAILILGGVISSVALPDATFGFIAFGVVLGLIYGLIAYGLPFVLKSISNHKNIAIIASVVLLAVPVLMAQQEWDDHDRSNKLLPPDLAKDYLESCAPNAIVFSFGDNDTYPLWYAQEVEGVRPDIRVINFSLLGIDWYINQLRYKVNQSDAIDVIWSVQQIEGGKRDYAVYVPKPNIPEDRYYDLYDMMKNYVGSDDPQKMQDRGGDFINTYPARKMSVAVDKALVLKNGTVNATDSVDAEVRFEIPKGALMKNDLAVLNIIAANKWNRPIYFTNSSADLGFDQYLRRDGLTWRLVPVANSRVNTDYAYNKLLNVFSFGNADKKGMYFDEENRRHLNSIRSAYTDVAIDLATKNRKDDAKKILNRVDKMMDPENFDYGMTSRGNMHNRNSLMFLEACYLSGDTGLAKKVAASIKKDLDQQMRYYNSLTGLKAEMMADEKRMADSYIKGLEQMGAIYNPSAVQIPGKLMAPDSPGKAATDTNKP